MRSLSIIAAGMLLIAPDAGAVQPDLSPLQLRLLNGQQRLELERNQNAFRARLGELSPQRERELTGRLSRQQRDLRYLQQRQSRRQQALRARTNISPSGDTPRRATVQLQSFKRQQRHLQLRQGVQRRSWSTLRR